MVRSIYESPSAVLYEESHYSGVEHLAEVIDKKAVMTKNVGNENEEKYTKQAVEYGFSDNLGVPAFTLGAHRKLSSPWRVQEFVAKE